jgi:hypothetical protein
MADDIEQRERLRQRFAVLQQPPATPPTPVATATPARSKTSMRRRDYKGERRRLNLRLPAAIVDDLNVLCLAARVDKNGFCEELLRRALDNQLPELRKQFTTEEWDVLQGCATESK